jgi:hypothetical protein
VHQVAEITALTPLDVRRTEYWSPTIAPSNIEFSPDGGGIPGWEEVAVGTLIAEHPLHRSGVRNYRTGLLPRGHEVESPGGTAMPEFGAGQPTCTASRRGSGVAEMLGFDDIRRSVVDRRMELAGVVVEEPAVESFEEGGCRLVAFLSRLGEQLHDGCRDRGRDTLRPLAGRDRLPRNMAAR